MATRSTNEKKKEREKKKREPPDRRGYRLSPDFLLDLFPGGWPAAMVWADLVAGTRSDDRFSRVAATYRNLDVRDRGTVRLDDLCAGTGITPKEFVRATVGCASAYGVDTTSLMTDMVTRPARLLSLAHKAMDPSEVRLRIYVLEELGVL